MKRRGPPTEEDWAAMDAEAALHDAIDAAWEAKTDAARAKAARKVLALEPAALDGYVILAQSIAGDAERIALLFEAARRGRRQWADAMKRPSAHDFWLDMETRPFMRALHILALLLWRTGERAEAIREAETLLKLNPNDNQGIRHLLLAWYPVAGAWGGVERILNRYKREYSTEYAWSACLNALRCGEDAAALLATAREVNPHVPAFLLDPDKTPEPDNNPLAAFGVEFGSDAEAAGYADFHREAWAVVPGALDWLRSECAAIE